MRIKITAIHPNDAHYWDRENIMKEELILIGLAVKSNFAEGYWALFTNEYVFTSCRYEEE